MNKPPCNSNIYIVAVSGGVDSIVLLNILVNQLNSNKPLESISMTEEFKMTSIDQLVVAHFDHGIRSDSQLDEKFVAQLAKKINLKYESSEGKLGGNASEEVARKARYHFFEKVVNKYSAKGLITAHHQDDELETAILNLIRGTNRRGLSSMRQNLKVIRPLLDTSKQEILKYARSNQLVWREDSTNTNEIYLRNYIRKNIMPKFNAGTGRKQLLEFLQSSYRSNIKIDIDLDLLLPKIWDTSGLNKKLFISLPHNVAAELLVHILRDKFNISQLSKRNINKLVIYAKTAKIGSKFDIAEGFSLQIEKNSLQIK